MDRLPLRLLLPYLVAGLLVLGVGGWSLRSLDGAGGAGSEYVAAEGAEGASAGGGETDVPVDYVAATSTTLPPAPPELHAAVFVQVAGAVRRPGVYEVPEGTRVFEVLLRAGGVREDGDEQALPLAALVADGMRVVVPVKGEAGAEAVAALGATSPAFVSPGLAGDAGGGAGSGAGIPFSLSTATAAELETLPGVGPKTAERIIAYREANGPFADIEELDDVPGIGPATVERLRDLVAP